MSYLQQYDSLEGNPEAQVALVSRWIRSNDWRPFFAELREERPFLRTPAFTLVARFDDVTEILSREQDFSVRLYAPKMDSALNVPFMLARDDTALNWREKGIMQAVLRPEDLPRIRELAGEFADEALDAAMPEGRIEVVSGLGRYVPIRICGAYFGFPGPDLDSMYRWSRATQSDMFKNLQNDPAVHEASVKAGEEMRTYLARLLQEKRATVGGEATGARLDEAFSSFVKALREHLARLIAGHAVGNRTLAEAGLQRILQDLAYHLQPKRLDYPEDIFSRLVRAYFPSEIGFDDQRIIANVAGLLIGAGETISQAAVQALRQILLRESVHVEAKAAAREQDFIHFDSYVWEALRFDPINPLVFRFCEQGSTVAAGTPRETHIAAGTTVFALTASAMSDSTVAPNPDAFRIDRPEFLRRLHFGYGHHACLGRYVAGVVIPEVIRRVLLRSVRLLPSPEGDVDFQGGPFPEHFVVAINSDPSDARP